MPRPGLITRRGALRLLGAGAALVVPFGAVARPVGAGQLLLAYAPAVTPAAPTPTAGVTPAEATQRPVVTPASAPAPALGVVDERRRGQVVVDGANLRSGPSTRAPIVGQVAMGTPLAVSGWVAGDDVAPDNPTWAQLDDQTFIYSAELRAGDLRALRPRRPTRPPRPAGSTST